MVAAQPLALRHTGENGGCGNHCAVGPWNTTYAKCSIVQHSLLLGRKIDRVRAEEKVSDSALLPCTNLGLNKAGGDGSASGKEQHGQYLYGGSCMPAH